MSYATGAVLDGLDPQLQEIQRKMFAGQPLTPKESARWAQRRAVEQETLRTGGRVTASIDGAQPPPPKAPITPEQAGARDATQARDYVKGQDSVLMAPQKPQMSPTGQPMTRRSQITNDASLEEKQADNARGPHMGADGLPATWNVPKQVVGREGFARQDNSTGPSSIRMMGADGNWKVWKDGKLQAEDQPQAPADAAAQSQPAAAPAAVAPEQPKPAAAPVPSASPKSSQPAQSDPNLAPSYSVKGLLQRAGTADQWAMAPANIAAFPGRVVDGAARAVGALANGIWQGDYRLPPSLTTTVGEAVGDFIGNRLSGSDSGSVKREVNAPPSSLPSAEAVAAARVPTPMGPTAQSMFESAIGKPAGPAKVKAPPVIDFNNVPASRPPVIDFNKVPAVPPPVVDFNRVPGVTSPVSAASQAPVAPPPGTPQNGEFNIYSLGPGRPGPVVTPKGPWFPNAIWNTTPANLNSRPRAYQSTAERFNPFSDRRRTSVLPE